jgi:hypothetical protein
MKYRMHRSRRILVTTLCAFTATISAIALAEQSSHESDAKMPPLILDGYTPSPTVIFRGESFDELVAVARPTFVWQHTLIWVDAQKGDTPRFSAAIPAWVKLSRGTLSWAILQRGKSNYIDREASGLATNDIVNASMHELEVVSAKPIHDGGAGDYALRILREHQYEVYELGIEAFWGGAGNWHEGRRLYVMRQPSGEWKLIGEGPAEGGGKSGWAVSYGTSCTATAILKPDDIDSVRIDFDTEEYYDGSLKPPGDVRPIDIHRTATLGGKTPGVFRRTSAPYILSTQELNTVDSIATSFVYWITDGGDRENSKSLPNAAVRAQIAKQNPKLSGRRLSPGTRVEVPASGETER